MEDQEQRDLIRIPAADGKGFSVAGANLTWKVRSSEAEGNLCVFEQVIRPGEGVPLHTHSCAEAFYVLSGTVQFVSDGTSNLPLIGEGGDTVIARPNTPHGFRNGGSETVRMLNISVAAHERFFDAVEQADRQQPFADDNPSEPFARVAGIGRETDTNFLPMIL